MAKTIGVAITYSEQRILVQYNLADYEHFFRDIARQLVSQLPATSSLIPRIQACVEPSSESDIFELVKMISTSFQKTYVVLDGLNTADTSGLEELVTTLGDCNISVFVTSRGSPPKAIFSSQPLLLTVEARASPADLRQYILSALHENGMEPTSESLNEEVISKLAEDFNGLYATLLCSLPMINMSRRFQPLYITPLSNSVTRYLLRPQQAISENPTMQEYDKTWIFCQNVVAQIQESDAKDMILCVLYHLIKLRAMGYKLTTAIAQEAVAAWGIQRDGVPYSSLQIIEACASLVFITRESQFMQLRSPLLADYLEAQVFKESFDEQQIIASMRYLSQDEFASGACLSSVELKNRQIQHRYLWCAARLIRTIGLQCDPELFKSHFMHFSSRSGCVDSYLQVAEAWPFEDAATYEECEESEERFNCFPPGYSRLHLAIDLAAPPSFIHMLLDQGEDIHARTSAGKTPLHHAVEFDADISALQALLARGSDVSLVDGDGETPLSIAVVRGSKEGVQLLLHSGADINQLDEDILLECMQEKPEIAKLLAERGVTLPDDEELC